MLFYFTGTGNSLYVAKQIEKDPISIPQVMRRGHLNFAAEAIGIVAPVYGHEVPPMVKKFLREGDFHTDYFYMILTYGNRHGGAAELAKQLCEECGILADYINVILMVDNWLPSFDMEEQKQLNKNVKEQLEVILTDIKNRKRMVSPVTEEDRAAHREFLDRMSQMPPDAWQHLLWVTKDCVGCGVCEKICPSASIRLIGGKAEHIPGNCQTCLACIHACPYKAIKLTIPEKNPNARYRNDHISLQEIVRSNHQG